ncbi:MerR family transcriptional regulator [Streptomyces sp. NPDC006553]|uniref:MerR family transcriptional regulator n=1 Tax=Streptomyces sp. NPDC006553 TaxID=3157180 RepID=UPI0033ACF76A
MVKTHPVLFRQGHRPAHRPEPGGLRLNGDDALTRLDLARTLRDLRLDLATVRKILDRDASLQEVTEANANALDVQIQTLRLRRAALRAVSRRGPTIMEMDLIHRLATFSQTERHQLVSDFVGDTFENHHANSEFVTLMRSVTPELPDDPTPEQVEAWGNSPDSADADFRVALRRPAEDQAKEPSQQDVSALNAALNRTMRERIAEAVSAGLLPASAHGTSPADSLAGLCTDAFERADDSDLRRRLPARPQPTADPHAERYWLLLATANGWPPSPTLAPLCL